MAVLGERFDEFFSGTVEGKRKKEQEKGAEIRAILSFRDRSYIVLEDNKKWHVN